MGGGGGKIDIKVVGTGYSAGADHFSGITSIALFIHIKLPVISLLIFNTINMHTALSMVVCLFHNYKLFSFTQYLPFAFSSSIFGGGGGVILTFTVFRVHARYLGELWPAQSSYNLRRALPPPPCLQYLDTIFS